MRILFALCICACAQLAAAQRIAWTCDGNSHDRDDWASSAFAIALAGDAGRPLDHFDYNSHGPTSSGTWESQMTTSVFGAAQRWFVPTATLFNDRGNRAAAVNSLAAKINSSTTDNRLTVYIAGPCTIIYDALAKTTKSKRAFVTFRSHSSWNTSHKHDGSKNWADCVRVFGPLNLQTLPNQNDRLFTRKDGRHDWAPWYPFRDSPPGSRNRWLWDRLVASGKPDASDAGMMFDEITGNATPTPADFWAALAN